MALLMRGAGFTWGVAAASAQTESRDGRGRSNWDVFADTPGRIADGSTNARCTEFDTRYAEDLDLLAAAGVPAFRFSTAWPRVQPDGPGAPDDAGLDLYSRIVDAMLERGIEPWVTLFHWDIPVWAGDFRDRDIVGRLADYADIVVARLGDRVRHWIGFNEPNSVAVLGYGVGRHAPGLASVEALGAAIHHQNVAVGTIIQAARARAHPGSLVGTTHNVANARPAAPTPADRAAAASFETLWNWVFLDPLFGRPYPEPFDRLLAPLIRPGDDAIAAARPDFLGVNYYNRLYARAADGPLGFERAEAPADVPRTAVFNVEPDGLAEALRTIDARYGAIPLYVTETGFALDDEPTWATRIDDTRRQAHLDRYLAAAAEARNGGVDLRGLFCWSATDNWEWSTGYRARFGLIAADPDTQRRGAKDSLAGYGAQVRRHFADAATPRLAGPND